MSRRFFDDRVIRMTFLDRSQQILGRIKSGFPSYRLRRDSTGLVVGQLILIAHRELCVESRREANEAQHQVVV